MEPIEQNAAMPERTKIRVGDVIAEKYRVERTLGEGGMGLVVAATHIELGSRRAIKVMLPEAASTPMAIERFLREARASSELKSQHVAHVFDVGRLQDGAPFMVMEHLSGQDLSAILEKNGALSISDAVHHVIEACDALAEAHGRGIVHRDLKPGNLFLAQTNDGSHHIKVLDFGISKLMSGDDGAKTRTGALMGSPLYMSPEQIQSVTLADARSDIWSLGIILYELITTQCPFDCDNVMGILARIAQDVPAPPSVFVKDIPKGLDDIILYCLQKKPNDRYQNVGELCRALAPFAPASCLPVVERIERIVAASPTPQRTSDTLAGPKFAAGKRTEIDPGAATLDGSVDQSSTMLAAPKASKQARLMPLVAFLFALLVAALGGALLMSQLSKEGKAAVEENPKAETPSAPAIAKTPTIAPSEAAAVLPTEPTPTAAPVETKKAPTTPPTPTKKTKANSTSGPPPRY